MGSLGFLGHRCFWVNGVFGSQGFLGLQDHCDYGVTVFVRSLWSWGYSVWGQWDNFDHRGQWVLGSLGWLACGVIGVMGSLGF